MELVRSRYPKGVDAIADFFSDGPTLTRLSEVVRRDGIVVSASGGADPEVLSQRGLLSMNINRTSPSRLEELTRLVDAGELKVAPTHAYPLEDAASAIAKLGDRRHVRGKVVDQPDLGEQDWSP